VQELAYLVGCEQLVEPAHRGPPRSRWLRSLCVWRSDSRPWPVPGRAWLIGATPVRRRRANSVMTSNRSRTRKPDNRGLSARKLATVAAPRAGSAQVRVGFSPRPRIRSASPAPGPQRTSASGYDRAGTATRPVYVTERSENSQWGRARHALREHEPRAACAAARSSGSRQRAATSTEAPA
jgi:hypothetical protein